MLANARNCVTALQNLSILQIIYLVPHHLLFSNCNKRDWINAECYGEYRSQEAYRERMDKKSEDQWREMKETAIEHLKSCSGLSPKVFRTVVVDHDGRFSDCCRFRGRMEEVQVQARVERAQIGASGSPCVVHN